MYSGTWWYYELHCTKYLDSCLDYAGFAFLIILQQVYVTVYVI